MAESLPSENTSQQKRRSTRIVQAVPITVSGVDALGQPFKERTTTVMVNCHGCKYQSKHYVPKNSTVTLEIPRHEPSLPMRTITGRVIWVQRPRTVRELFQIGLEFDVAGNVWGIAFPPSDWFPFPGDEPPPVTAPPPTTESKAKPETPVQPAGETKAAVLAAPAPPSAASPQAPTAADAKIHVVPPPAAQDAQLAAARQTAKMVAEAKETLDKTLRRSAQAAINEEMTVVRQQLDVQLHEAVERAIKLSMERVSESAAKRFIQQAAERTAAIVEEARKATNANTTQIEARIREAVDSAVSQATAKAAQQAAQQVTSQTLSQAVEEAVERAISQREAAAPSLSILSSPDAAQQHLESWKANLEEAAQTVRAKTIDQAEADAQGARERWRQEFEAAASEASKNAGAKLAETAQAALAQAERDIATRQSGVRESLDTAVADAHAKLESIGAGLEQQRAAAQQMQAQMEESARASLEQTQHQLHEMLAAQQEQAARRTDQVIAERLGIIEPALQDSARRTIERYAAEFDQTLAPTLEVAQKTAADLVRAGDEAGALEGKIRAQLRQAVEQAAQAEAAVRAQSERIAEQAGQAETAIREQVARVSEQALQESLERLRQESGKLPAEFEQSCRATLAKLEEDLDQKSTEAQHETYEALSKAADWYQKKAQTTMQTALDKAVDQSTTSLRSRAAEISSLVASELDHYRRSYVEHSRAEIEDAAKEALRHEQKRMNESVEIAHATLTDRVQQTTDSSLRRFEEASRLALEKARSDIEYTREQSLADFQKNLEERMAQSVEHAQVLLQSQLGPVMEAWEAKRQQQQREWLEQVKKSADESIEHYKSRLENASNSWLLASATTLGQHSQAVLDTLAKSAERRMRETIAEVLAGMGDTLKDRLLGISTNFGAEPEDDDFPSKKK